MLPRGWAACELTDIAADDKGAITDGPFGSALKSDHYTSSGVRVIRLGNIGRREFHEDDEVFIDAGRFDELRRHEAKAGDLVTAALGEPLGRTASVPAGYGPAIVKADCFRFRPAAGIDQRLLLYWLNSPDVLMSFLDRSQGIGRVRINLSTFRSTVLPLPPLAEQRRIVAKLDALTARIAQARAELGRLPSLSERLRTSALRQATAGALTAGWRRRMHQVETVEDMLRRVPPPVQGRGGREATDKVIPGRGGLSVNDPESSLPPNWQWVSLLRLAKQETGHTPSRSQPSYWDGGIAWIGIRDAGTHHGRYIHETFQTISEEGLANSSARLLPAGPVCLSRTASVGYITILGQPMATSQDFATWTCGKALVPEYLMFALMAEGNDIRRFGMGSTHTTIYFPEIRALHIALPPLDEQREVVARVKAAFARADRLDAEAARAAKLLDRLETAILAKAFRGELVPQDPADEPASVLLDRIRADRAAVPKPKRGRRASAGA